MKRRHKVSEIIRILGEVESGAKVSEICRVHNIAEQTYYHWRKKYGGLTLSEAVRLKALEEENSRLKRKVADLLLETDLLKELQGKNF